MLRIDQTEARIRVLLAAACVDSRHPVFGETWDVFKQLAREPVDSSSDGLLFEAGTYAFGGPERFVVDFLRQFEVVGADGAHDHFEQLRCEFEFEVTTEVSAFGSFERWCYPNEGDDLESFFAEVEDRPEFRFALGGSPVSARVEQEGV